MVSAGELLWTSSTEEDQRWLDETAALDWADYDEAEEATERVLIATAVVVYDLVDEAWKELASGKWTTLYLVEELFDLKISLRLAALDPTSQSEELIVASAIMGDGSIILDDGADDPTFGELSCGTANGEEVAVYGLRFASAEAARTFKKTLHAACATVGLIDNDADDDDDDDDAPDPRLVADSPKSTNPASGAQSHPSSGTRKGFVESRPSDASQSDRLRQGAAMKSIRGELEEMGFPSAQISAALVAVGAASVDAYVNWIIEHPESAAADESLVMFFTAEAVENTGWTLVEEAAHATLTAFAFDNSAAVDPDRAARAARSACACARALLEGEGTHLASRQMLDEWWRAIAEAAVAIPATNDRAAAREAAKFVARTIKVHVHSKTSGNDRLSLQMNRGAEEVKLPEPPERPSDDVKSISSSSSSSFADLVQGDDDIVAAASSPGVSSTTTPRRSQTPLAADAYSSRGGGRPQSSSSGESDRVRELATAVANVSSESSRARRALAAPLSSLRRSFLAAMVSRTAKPKQRPPRNSRFHAAPPTPNPPTGHCDVRPSNEWQPPPFPSAANAEHVAEDTVRL